ncbi:MAG: diadenylate cyclase CdaA [Acidobacteriota bacterium]|nr:diadenylate cyclase CdaA [Acidobacteriota bacterium]
MSTNWLELITWRDFVDVFLVAVIAYNLLLLIRGTRTVQILLGLVFLAGIWWAARETELTVLETLLRNFIIFLPFAVIVLFQHEIRRGLARFGRNPLLGFGSHEKVETTIHEIVLATAALAAKRIGALIVIQRSEGLRNFIENGIELDARVSYDLLVNIFSPDTPLHDGAVIINQDRVAAAACFLPLTLDSELSTEFGTRHRAALGITEETDAMTVVVSEETGKISVAVGGKLASGLESKQLRNTLYQYLIADLSTAEGEVE